MPAIPFPEIWLVDPAPIAQMPAHHGCKNRRGSQPRYSSIWISDFGFRIFVSFGRVVYIKGIVTVNVEGDGLTGDDEMVADEFTQVGKGFSQIGCALVSGRSPQKMPASVGRV